MLSDDPRSALAALAVDRGESLAALSRLIGRNAAYLQQFVTRGSPRRLDEADRRTLARYLGVAESALGGPAENAALVRIRRVDAVASAGPGGLLDHDRADGGEMIDPRVLRELGARAENLSIIAAQGSSMEPTIVDGDDMLVDRGDRRVPDRGGIFVVRRDGALMVKRLARQGRTIRVISDNPEFPPLPPGPVEIIGRVVRLSRRLR
ncbi:MAG: peptidase S24 [Sphingomonas sp. 28-66-16]|nr:MAG: peptidase S24 [Sphingomonas sp. 28-66-16]